MAATEQLEMPNRSKSKRVIYRSGEAPAKTKRVIYRLGEAPAKTKRIIHRSESLTAAANKPWNHPPPRCSKPSPAELAAAAALGDPEDPQLFMVHKDVIYDSLTCTDCLIIPEFGANLGFTPAGGDLFALPNGSGTFDLFYNNGIVNAQITDGSVAVVQALQDVLLVGNTTDGVDMFVTGGSNVILPTVATTATSGFIRISNMPGVPSGNPGTTGGELVYNTVGSSVYVHVGAGIWQQLNTISALSLWEQAVDASTVDVVRTNLVAQPDADSRLWIMGGAQNKNDPVVKSMFDPVGASYWGGTVTGTNWDAFGTNTDHTMVFGNDHIFTVGGGFNINQSAVIGGYANVLTATAANASSNILMGGQNNAIIDTTRNAIVAGQSNTINAPCTDCHILGSANCTMTGSIIRSGIHSCDDCTIINPVGTCPNNQMFASAGCDLLNTGFTNKCSVIASKDCSSSTALSMLENSFIACNNCTYGGGLSTTTSSAMIACENSSITNNSHTSCAILGGFNNSHIGTSSQSVIIGGQNLTCNESDAVYVPSMFVNRTFTLNSSAVLASRRRIGQVTLAAGTATVGTQDIDVNDCVIVSVKTIVGGTGLIRVSATSPGTPGSFTIVSSSGADTSVVGWIIIRQT